MNEGHGLWSVCENSKFSPAEPALSLSNGDGWKSDLSKLNLKSASVQQPLFTEPLPFPLSSRAKPTCLRQVKGGMNIGKGCSHSRPRGPAPKISPVRKSLSENQDLRV
jgi:hypothetical protein